MLPEKFPRDRVELPLAVHVRRGTTTKQTAVSFLGMGRSTRTVFYRDVSETAPSAGGPRGLVDAAGATNVGSGENVFVSGRKGVFVRADGLGHGVLLQNLFGVAINPKYMVGKAWEKAKAKLGIATSTFTLP